MLKTTSGVPLSQPFRTARIKAREVRNGFPIHGYTGSNGGGKTMAAVYDALPALAAGYPIVSTCRILDPATGGPHPLWVPLDDFRILLDLEYCEVILDEVTGVASSRESAGLPSSVLNRLMQLRKGDVTVRWTTPNWKRADTGIREVTQALTTAVGLMPVENSTVNEHGMVRRWKQRRLFIWRTYDARNFDDWTTAKERSKNSAHRLRPIARQAMWGPGAIVRDCYDTYEHALSLGVVNDAGMCLDCGAARSKPRCTCDRARERGEHVDRDDSPGMIRWRQVHAARLARTRAAAGLPTLAAAPAPAPLSTDTAVEIPETDDTPGVVVDLASTR